MCFNRIERPTIGTRTDPAMTDNSHTPTTTYDAIAEVIDAVKTDERNLDTDQYVAQILTLLDPDTAQVEQDEFIRLAQAAHDVMRAECEEETEEPPPTDEAFVAGARWALDRSLFKPRTWTFFGHWRDHDDHDELVIEDAVLGEHEDLRTNNGLHQGGLWSDSASGADLDAAEQTVRSRYES